MKNTLVVLGLVAGSCGCASPAVNDATPEQAARIDRKLVKDAVVFEPGAEDGAVVPEVSAPCLRAVMVDEKRESKRIIERHREWFLDCDVSLLGIPNSKRKATK